MREQQAQGGLMKNKKMEWKLAVIASFSQKIVDAINSIRSEFSSCENMYFDQEELIHKIIDLCNELELRLKKIVKGESNETNY
jgi:hypothetical protein